MCLLYWRCLCHCADCDMTRFSSIFRKHRNTLFGNVCESVKSQPTNSEQSLFLNLKPPIFVHIVSNLNIYLCNVCCRKKINIEKNPNQEQGNGKTSSSSSMCNNKWCCRMHIQHKYKLKRMYISDIKTHQKNMLHNVRCHSTHIKCSYTLVHLCDATFNISTDTHTHSHTWCCEWCLNGNRKKDFTIHFDGMDDNDCHRYMIFAMSFRRRNFSLSLVFPVISFQAPSVFLSPHTLTSLDSILCFHVLRNVAHTAIPNKTKMLSTNHTLLLLLIKLRCFRCGFYNFF